MSQNDSSDGTTTRCPPGTCKLCDEWAKTGTEPTIGRIEIGTSIHQEPTPMTPEQAQALKETMRQVMDAGPPR